VFVDKGRTIQRTTRILVLRTEKPFDASDVLDDTELAEDWRHARFDGDLSGLWDQRSPKTGGTFGQPDAERTFEVLAPVLRPGRRSSAADLTADPAAVGTALAGSEVFAKDGLSHLLPAPPVESVLDRAPVASGNSQGALSGPNRRTRQ
jgi:hypothetical protein